jgi:hypothetical protein
MIEIIANLALAMTVGTPASAVPRVINDRGSIIATVSDSMPVLTVDVLTKMTTFLNAFMQEPDSIKTTARKANQMTLVVSVGANKQMDQIGMDLVAMATKYPSVAADLKAVGLTAQEWQAYRWALNSASATVDLGMTAPSGSVLAKNVAFFRDHEKEIHALEASGMSLSHIKRATGAGAANDNNMDP